MFENVFTIVFLLMNIAQLYFAKQSVYECKNNYGRTMIVLHGVLSMYLMFGAYFSNNYVHLFIVSSAFLIHYFNNKTCPITVIHNEICGFDRSERLPTFINNIIPHEYTLIIYYTILSCAIVFNLFQIFVIKKESVMMI